MQYLPAPLKTYLQAAALAALGLLGACGDKPRAGWSGYAEGDYVYVSSPLGGRLDKVFVSAGQQVAQGAPLFALDAESETAARDEAAARLGNAQAQVADLAKGKRAEEISVATAQLNQAQANASLARAELERQQQLLAQGFVAKAHVDDAATSLKQAQARVAELSDALKVAALPARSDQRDATAANARAAQQVLRQSEWRNSQKQQAAPAAALVADVLFQPGEYVQPGQPVVSLLPPANTKARFFVPEADLAALRLGQKVQIRCDGCGAPIPATVSRIATQPEFTPPILYSNTQRSKLVFMVEAKPDAAQALQLKPGQPLDVVAAPTSAAP
ncbi:MAG: HlyD family efflux transporter periplasmic adaptor subunit [Rhodoferax sp.]|nr:HlyD family efflux transporter periplasmic adaptor subunit [Rhodoferax sp.]